MQEGWKNYRFDEITINLDKKRIPLSSFEREKRQGAYPYYGAQGIIDYIDDYIFEGQFLLIAEDGENLKSRKMPVAQLAEGKFWVNNHAHIVKNNDLSDIRFLYYVFNRIDISGYITGSAQPKLSQTNLNAISFSLPPLPIQKAIADMLSALDEKIEVNNQINKKLEEIAQALFRRWFVDFEFPDENGNPYKFSGGDLVESEMGLIPRGWRVEQLKNLCTLITKGTTPTTLKRQFTKKGVNFIKAESITDDHLFDTNKFAFIDDETNNLLKRSIIQEGDIIYTIAGTIGRFALASLSILPANTNQAVAIIRTDMLKMKSIFVFNYLLCGLHKSFLESRIVQAVQANLSLGVLGELPIITPDKGTLNRYHELLMPIFEKIEITCLNNNLLNDIRDFLLPRLISGSIKTEKLN